MKNKTLLKTIELLNAGQIIEAIRETQGWYSPERNNPIFLLHDKLKNFFFDRAFQKLPIHYRKKLISKFNHITHFVEGVSKSHAIEYYYLCLDAFEKDGYIKGLEGGYVRMTTEMKFYYKAINLTVVEIADNKSLLKDLIYEVAKQLSNIFYERLELICKELFLSGEVEDDVYVSAPIPYKEYRFGNHTTVKCFEPDIAFSMVVIGLGDTLKPIDEYIAEIKESEAYKIFTSECRCNNCMTYFESDDDLIDGEDEDGAFKGCPKCNTDKYLMNLANLK